MRRLRHARVCPGDRLSLSYWPTTQNTTVRSQNLCQLQFLSPSLYIDLHSRSNICVDSPSGQLTPITNMAPFVYQVSRRVPCLSTARKQGWLWHLSGWTGSHTATEYVWTLIYTTSSEPLPVTPFASALACPNARPFPAISTCLSITTCLTRHTMTCS